MEICDNEKQENLFSQASISRLIDDISYFPSENVEPYYERTMKFSWIEPLILFLAIIAGSSIGPVTNMYGDVNPFIKNIWRSLLNFIF